VLRDPLLLQYISQRTNVSLDFLESVYSKNKHQQQGLENEMINQILKTNLTLMQDAIHNQNLLFQNQNIKGPYELLNQHLDLLSLLEQQTKINQVYIKEIKDIYENKIPAFLDYK
jgi:hypothetical protein